MDVMQMTDRNNDIAGNVRIRSLIDPQLPNSIQDLNHARDHRRRQRRHASPARVNFLQPYPRPRGSSIVVAVLPMKSLPIDMQREV
jgi:hypothetical protein